MMKKISQLLKKIIMSFLLLYSLNYFITYLHVYIPINFLTLGITTFLGLPGLSALIILFFIVK